MQDLNENYLPDIAPIEEKRSFHFIGINDLLKEIQPPDWLLSGYLEKDTVAQMVGKPNAGKSLLALDWALCIASGTPWNGIHVDTAPVCYINGEGHAGMRRRIKAWQIEHGIDLEGIPFAMSSQAAHLADSEAAGDVFEQIEHGFEQKPGLIIVDTLARNYGADENSSADMARFLGNVDELLRIPFGACVLILHHSGHADRDTGRGSTVLIGGIDNSFKVTLDASKQVTLKVVKLRDGEYPAEVTQDIKAIEMDGLDKFGNPFTAPVLIPATSTSKPIMESSLGINQQKSLRALRLLIKQAESDSEDGEIIGIKISAWREQCRSSGIDRKRWKETSNSLMSKRLIRMEGDYVYLCE
jgi:hypothetical protein